ncbi:MAG: ComF family protein [Candidatus Falkowbacteria bacterium]
MLKLLKDILFPVECLFCKKYGVWLCPNCAATIKFEAHQSCPSCHRLNAWGELCVDCQKDFFFDGIFVAGDYHDQKLAQLIKNYKYNFLKDLGVVLADFMIGFIKEKIFINSYKHILNRTLSLSSKNTLVIPVPLSSKRQRWRGFNQAEIIADYFAANLNLSINKDLKRLKHKSAQAKLSEAERQKNIDGVFVWTGVDIKGKRIILVDDVSTTGATLNEGAKVLKAAGAEAVWGLVIASN